MNLTNESTNNSNQPSIEETDKQVDDTQTSAHVSDSQQGNHQSESTEVTQATSDPLTTAEVDYSSWSEQSSEDTSVDEDDYYQAKAQDHARIESLIEQSEKELADLKLRKSMMESDFEGLHTHYQQLIIGQKDISTIAKKTLLEYYAYEFLKPLKTIQLAATDKYDTWQTKHFYVRFQLTESNQLDLYFKLNPINSTYESNYLPLLTIDSAQRAVMVNDDQILHLVRQWHAENIFSVNQLSLFNYDVNQILAHIKELGFSVSPSLIDNTQQLSVDMETDFPVSETVLDQIFITTMENESYDLETENLGEIRILLDKNQRLTIQMHPASAVLTIDSGQWRRSLLDFFTSYAFLVPLVVPSK